METAVVKLNEVQNAIVELRGENVILDADVAVLYGVGTKHVNQAVRNNPEKFPAGYVLVPTAVEWAGLRSKILTTSISPKSRAVPKAFTERGLYMLATILKGERATATTIAIIDAFAKLRELSRTVAELAEAREPFKQKSLMQRGGEVLSDMLDADLESTGSETSFEIDLAVLKFKHTIHRAKRLQQPPRSLPSAAKPPHP